MNTVIIAFIALFNYAVVICDAMTDAAVNRISAGWWEWHLSKWIRYYLPQGFILGLLLYNNMLRITKINVLSFITYILIGWLLWQLVYTWNPLSNKN